MSHVTPTKRKEHASAGNLSYTNFLLWLPNLNLFGSLTHLPKFNIPWLTLFYHWVSPYSNLGDITDPETSSQDSSLISGLHTPAYANCMVYFPTKLGSFRDKCRCIDKHHTLSVWVVPCRISPRCISPHKEKHTLLGTPHCNPLTKTFTLDDAS